LIKPNFLFDDQAFVETLHSNH